VNLAGGEFGGTIPGVDGVDYRFPTTDEIDHFVSRGMNTFRVGFLWERLQPKAKGEFVAAYLAHLDALVDHATAAGAFVVLNPHNYARYYGTTVGSPSVPNDVFADFWGRIAARWASNPRVMFNLVNEPHDIPSEQWVGAANAAIAAIRAAGAKNTIIAPGNGWTGAWTWNSSGYGTPNATAMLAISDPADNVLFEVHQYLDASGSGGGDCLTPTIGSERLAPFVAWLRANHKRGFLGEFAGADNATCRAAISDMLAYMTANADVLDGWLWWAAGPGWGPNYPLTLEPQNGVDRPQMALLAPFLVR
jgi:endoglucanase